MNDSPAPVEVDEFVIGSQKPGKRVRGADGKTIVVAAVEKKGKKLGRIRLQVVPDCSGAVLEPFVLTNVDPGSTTITDGWKGYPFLDDSSYTHHPMVASRTSDKDSVLPGVHLVASLVKRLILGTFQGRFDPEYLQSYLDEYVFRFNHRTSCNIGKKFMRMAQQINSSSKTIYQQIRGGTSSYSLLAN